MKKLFVLVLVFASCMTTQAQENKHIPNYEIAVKKMVLSLDLSDDQAQQIGPLVKEQVKFMQTMKSSEINREDKQMQILDQKITFQRAMKNILNVEQYKQFRNLEKKRMQKRSKR